MRARGLSAQIVKRRESRESAISRHAAPEFWNWPTLFYERGRREDRVSADTRGPRAEKKARGRTTGFSPITGLPCAIVWTAYTYSPRGPAWLPVTFADHPPQSLTSAPGG